MISAIVAVDENWGIGFNGQLLEHIPEDMKFFKKITTGNVVIMGRKTWESLPIKPLPDRLNLVVTSKGRGVDCMTALLIWRRQKCAPQWQEMTEKITGSLLAEVKSMSNYFPCATEYMSPRFIKPMRT